MQIQWYPGHMAKARRMLAENLKLIDAVVEILDARAPIATRNPDFDSLFAAKRRVVLLNKSDLADPAATRAFLKVYEGMGFRALSMTATNSQKKGAAVELLQEAVRDEVERLEKKGVKKTVRILVAGIPNVGKSTFINRLAGSNRAQVGDRPGVTKGKQWVKVSPYLELMDTPGLLWPKRYKKLEPGMEPGALLEGVCRGRGFLLPGGVLDTERAARIVLDEFRGGKIGRVTLDDPRYERQDADGQADS